MADCFLDLFVSMVRTVKCYGVQELVTKLDDVLEGEVDSMPSRGEGVGQMHVPSQPLPESLYDIEVGGCGVAALEVVLTAAFGLDQVDPIDSKDGGDLSDMIDHAIGHSGDSVRDPVKSIPLVYTSMLYTNPRSLLPIVT